MLWPAHILQAVPAEIEQCAVWRQIVCYKWGCGLREQYLAAMSSVRNAGGAVDVHPDVAFLRDFKRFTGMNSHAKSNDHPPGPLMRRQRSLGVSGGGDGLACALECVEKCIPLRIDFLSIPARENAAENFALIGKQLSVAFTEIFQ
jgi:hypothetical protein